MKKLSLGFVVPLLLAVLLVSACNQIDTPPAQIETKPMVVKDEISSNLIGTSWTGTFEIIGDDDQRPVEIWNRYKAFGEFSFTILNDDTIEGSGTARGEYTAWSVSGDGTRHEEEAKFTTSFSVTGEYYPGIESVIEFRDFSPPTYAGIAKTIWARTGKIDVIDPYIPRPILDAYTFRAIGIEFRDGATDESTSGFGGTGEIRRVVWLSRQD